MKKKYEEEDIRGIANAIRRKNGTTNTYKTSQMEAAIDSIPTGGGFTPSGTVNITSNGTVRVYDYEEANVNVPQGVFPSGTLQISENGEQTVTNYEKVNVSVPQGVFPSGTLNITENGTQSVTNYANVNVNVPQGITPSGSIDITENGTYDVTSLASAIVNVSGGGGMPDNLVMGDFTPQSNLTEYTVSHNKGVSPQVVVCYADDLASTTGYLHIMSIGYKNGDSIVAAVSYNNYNGGRQLFQANYGGVSAMTDSEVTFNTRGGSYIMKTGYTYHYVLIFEEV